MQRASSFYDHVAFVTLMLAAAAILLPCLAAIPLIRAEAMFALIPKEMLEAGQYLTPTLNGVPYLDKPPLIYWLTLAAYQMFGVAEGTARAVNLLCALGEIGFTCLIGLRLFNRRAAWLAGFILFTSVGFFSQHLVIYTDHLISLCLAASVYFVLRWQEKRAPRWAVLFYLCLAAGFLSKGFIGLLFPLAVGGLYALCVRQRELFRLFFWPWGWVGVLLLTTPWLAAMEIHHPGFLRHHLVNEQILRFLGQRHPKDVNSFSLPAFWLLLGIWLLPWTPLLPAALYRFWQETVSGEGRRDPRGRLILIWAAMVLGFFTLSASRIEYYCLPALPALALVLGWRVQKFTEFSRDPSICWALWLLALAAAALLLVLPRLEELLAANRRELIGLFEQAKPTARQIMVVIPLLASVGALLGWHRPARAVVAYGLVAVVLLSFTFQTYSALSPLVSDKIPGEYIRRFARPGDLVVMEYIEEFEYGASLAYYADRRILMVKRGQLPQFPYPVAPEKSYLIFPERLKELWQGENRVFLLADEVVAPEPFLKEAPVQVALTGKRLLINQSCHLADKN